LSNEALPCAAVDPLLPKFELLSKLELPAAASGLESKLLLLE